MAGTFYPIKQYYNDLAKSMNGLSQVYPSRFIAVPEDNRYENLVTEINGIVKDDVNSTDIDYAKLRKDIIEKLLGDGFNNGYVGDINFLSYDGNEGTISSEVYVEATYEMSEYDYSIVTNEPADKDIFVITKKVSNTTENLQSDDKKIEELADTPTAVIDEGTEYTIGAIIIFYNMYQIDPETGKQTNVIVKDMPMGVYVPEKAAEVSFSSEAYGGGSWVARLSTALSNGNVPTVTALDSNTSAEFIESTSRLLTSFGEACESILKTHSEEKAAYDDISAAIDGIKGLKNTPYIKDGAWYVNGKYQGEAVNTEILKAAGLEEMVTNAVNEVINGNVAFENAVNSLIDAKLDFLIKLLTRGDVDDSYKSIFG